MGEQRDTPKVATDKEGAPVTFTSAPASTSKSVEASTVPPHPTTTAIAIGFIGVLHKFLRRLIEKQDETTICLTGVDSEFALLYGQIQP